MIPSITLPRWIIPSMLLFGCYLYTSHLIWSSLQNNSFVVFCDVGQGDASYIRIKNTTDILIDSGRSTDVLDCLNTYMPFYDRTIEYVIISHPDSDHMDGTHYVLNHYVAETLIITHYANQDTDVNNLLDIYHDRINTIEILSKGDRIQGSGFFLMTYWPPANYTTESNASSLVFTLEVNETSILYTGDTTPPVLSLIVDDLPSSVDILKVPHHGSKTGLIRSILPQTTPDTAVISVGSQNGYGHPHRSILEMLEEFKIPTRRTDVEGGIKFAL